MIIILSLVDPVLTSLYPWQVVDTTSREQQAEASVSQAAMPSRPRMGPSNAVLVSPTIGNESLVPLPPKLATQKPRIPRITALINGLTRPNKRLVTAAHTGNFSLVCEILNDQSDLAWLDGVSLRKAMYYAVDQGHEEAVRLLLEQGADANADGVAGTVLQRASEDGHE
jgi:hypothetical protein